MRHRRDGTTAEQLFGAGPRVTATHIALLETVRNGDRLGIEAITSGVRDHVPRSSTGGLCPDCSPTRSS